jgi:hypothetical protein
MSKENVHIYTKMIIGNPCVLVRAEAILKNCFSEEVFE